MEAWKKGAFVGGLWGFISWFGLGVAMSDFYVSSDVNRPGRVLETLFHELVKVTLFLPAFLVVQILKISRETDPVSGAFSEYRLVSSGFPFGNNTSFSNFRFN